MSPQRLSKLVDKLLSPNGRNEIYTRSFSSLFTYKAFRVLSRIWYRNRKDPEQWVFLLGCYNSGTTILRDVLGVHPSVGTMPREGVRFSEIFPTPEQYGWYRMTHRCPVGSMVPKLDEPSAVRDQLVNDWAAWMGSGKPVFLEKSISHSARLEWLGRMFPQAKFVIIHRDGYSSAEGIQRKARAIGAAAQELGGNKYSISDCAREWDQLNRGLVKFSEQSKNLNIKVIKYEQLCASPGPEISSLLDFLEVSQECLSTEGEHTVVIGKERFEIKNMNHKSHSRLSQKDYEAIEAVAGSTLENLGYSRKEQG